MGREAQCECTWDGGHGPVKALLETDALIVRGGLKRVVPLAGIARCDVVGEELCIADAHGTVQLRLGAKQAASWAAKLRAPPPSLRDKLGLAGSAKAFLVGVVDDAAVGAVLRASQAGTLAEADMTIAVVTRAQDLDAALNAHASLPREAPLWIVYRKGKNAEIGEAVVRQHLRAAGYRDTKVAAVSDRLTATRFTPAKPHVSSPASG